MVASISWFSACLCFQSKQHNNHFVLQPLFQRADQPSHLLLPHAENSKKNTSLYTI